LLAVSGARTVENTLAPYDNACWHLRMAGSQSGVMFMVHPLAAVRDAAQELQQAISAEGTALSLNREVYEALRGLDVSGQDAATKYYVERALLGYRLSGVDKDEATRERIRALADKMTELSMSFSRTVQDDVRKIEVADAEELRGLPEDYLVRHGVREAGIRDKGQGIRELVADGPIVLTTDPPEMSPVMSYAVSAKLRRQDVSRLQRPRLPGEQAGTAGPAHSARGDGWAAGVPELGGPGDCGPDDGVGGEDAQVPE
jgi:thimet oligopeptidase